MMNEFDLLKSQSFNYIDRSEHFDALQINEKISFEYNLFENSMKYCIIRNVLKYPDKFIKLMKLHPAYGGSIRVSSPGFRQLFSPIEFNPIIQIFGSVHSKLYNESIPPVYKWICCSNIYYNGMTGNPKPHNDGSRTATNLWLSENMEDAGTAFYKLKYNNNEYYNFNDTPKEAHNILLQNVKDQEQWYAFNKDDNWEKYYMIPAEYNSVVIYDGRYYHNSYYEPKNYPEDKIRYSFVSFLQQ